ncbi:MAG: TIGR01777 family protein [Chloroflexi bacterium]|nr:TIGR01777 family protein [Chloroflexota bacterium]
MKIILTGGTGLIGSALIEELVRAKNEIVVTSRAPEKAKTLPRSVKVVKWDGQTAEGWGVEADGADAIVNLAGAPIAPLPWTRARKEIIHASRVNAGQAIVDAVTRAKNKPRVVVQSSAVGYYGLHGAETLTENSKPGSDYLANVCVDWENATALVEALGVRRAIYRTGLVLARQGGILPRMALPFHLFVGGRVGSGKQWMSWIHIADEVAAIQFLMANENARGVFNLTAPEPVRNQDFATALGRALGRPSAIPVPAFAMKLPLGEMAELLLLGGQRVAPERLQQMGFQFRFSTLPAALENVYHR